MRHSLVIPLILSFSVVAIAAPKEIADFYSESKALSADLKASSKKELKIKKLKELEASFKKTREEYQKQNPEEGSEAEQKVNVLYYTFEPLFDFTAKKTWDDKACIKLKFDISKDEEKTTPEQEEALKWVKILCD